MQPNQPEHNIFSGVLQMRKISYVPLKIISGR